MKQNLYDRLTTSKDEPFRDIFASLNLSGYALLDDINCDDELKDNIVRYIIFAYSYDSEMLRTHKERSKVKELIANKVGLSLIDRLVIDVLKNKNAPTQKFITWWLNEYEHPLWRRYISGLDLEAEKLEIMRTGLDMTISGTTKEIERAVKQLTKDSKLKTQAFQDVVLIRKQLDEDKAKLDQTQGFMEGIIKKEVPEAIGIYDSWAEYLVAKNSQKSSSPKINLVPLENTKEQVHSKV